MDERSRLDRAGGECCAVALPLAHPEIKERCQADLLRESTMAGLLRGDIGQQAVVESRRIGAMKYSRGRCRRKALKDDGNLCPRRDDCAGDRREFAPAQAAQNFERILKMTGVQGERMIDSLRLPADHRSIGP